MSTEPLHRFRCDSPHCHATAYSEKITDAPDGWRTLRSNDHIPIEKTSRYPARRPRNTLTYSERSRGSFALHLCPAHPTAFDAHLPRTDGFRTRPGRDGMANVSCSCGISLGYTSTSYRIASADMSGPSAYTEKTWWQHLPEDLRWYAARTTEEQQ